VKIGQECAAGSRWPLPRGYSRRRVPGTVRSGSDTIRANAFRGQRRRRSGRQWDANTGAL